MKEGGGRSHQLEIDRQRYREAQAKCAEGRWNALGYYTPPCRMHSRLSRYSQPVDRLVFFLCNLDLSGIKSLCRTPPTSHTKDQWAFPAM